MMGLMIRNTLMTTNKNSIDIQKQLEVYQECMDGIREQLQAYQEVMATLPKHFEKLQETIAVSQDILRNCDMQLPV